MTPNQITAIIEEHKDIYDLIEEKQKEKALNEG